MNNESPDNLQRWIAPFLSGLLKVVLGAVLLLILVPILFPFGVGSVLGTLLLGWMAFLGRTLPRISLNPDLIGMAMVCAGLILAGLHWFLNWVCRHRGEAMGMDREDCHWPWRRTWCGVAVVGLSFFIGSALVGTVHQVGWMMFRSEPLMELKAGSSGFGDMQRIEGAFRTALLESNGGFEEARLHLWHPKTGYFPQGDRLREAYHVLAIVSPDDQLRGLIIFPRDQEQRSKWGGLYQFGVQRDSVAAEVIPPLLSRHRHELRTI